MALLCTHIHGSTNVCQISSWLQAVRWGLPKRKIGNFIGFGIEFRIRLNRNTPEFGGIRMRIDLAIELL